MWVTLSLVALLVAALCWIVGDMLIVGFAKPDPEIYGEFIARLGDDAYAYHLTASEARLRWGALIANYSTPLLLAGLYAHAVIVRPSYLGLIGVIMLGIGITLSPLAHAAFYPLALASQRAYHAFRSGADASAEILHARHLFRFLHYAWLPAVGLTYLGGILIVIPIAMGHTALPWWTILFAPIVWVVPMGLLTKLPYPGKPLLDGAALNLVLVIWASALLVLTHLYPPVAR
ncbi:MAG: hypothetical protein Q4Q03_01330 [Bowdeniella nasicola]|nr:hypothetical protein [Bowdeniella nasicola]